MQQKIIQFLNKMPLLKRTLKNVYIGIGALLSDKKTYPDNIECISGDQEEHLFGYYDKSPWNKIGNKMVYLEVKNANKEYASTTPASIVLYDLNRNIKEKIADTRTWNVQQGCMLQWFSGSNKHIIFNDYRDGEYCSIIFDIEKREERKLCAPIYSVSKDGKFAIFLDFSRLNTFRPGYGYSNIPDCTKYERVPDKHCVWYLDITNNNVVPLFKYSDLIKIGHKPTMDRAFHKVNHIMISPDSKKFMFLHRWIVDDRKYDRLIVYYLEDKSFQILLDEDMVSHSNWRNGNEIITYARTNANGNAYYLIRLDPFKIRCLKDFFPNVDGHPSFSPDGKYVVTDTYPDFKRKQKLFIIDFDRKQCRKVVEIYSNYRYKNENRCDMHPRWNPNSDEICFDGAQKRKRQVYAIKVGDILNEK